MWVVLVPSGRSCPKLDDHSLLKPYVFIRKVTVGGFGQLRLTLSVTQRCCVHTDHHRVLVTVPPAALEAGPCPSPPPKSGCLLAALSRPRARLRVLARTSSSCLRRAWTESSSVCRTWTFSELRKRRRWFKSKNRTTVVITGSRGARLPVTLGVNVCKILV